MITIILIMIASICNAIQDILAHHHSISIFGKYKKGFWSDATQESWKEKYIDWDGGNRNRKKWIFGLFNLPVQFTDAWHLFKSLMVVLFVLAIVLYKPFFGILIDFFVLGAIWNLEFLSFYNKILVVRKNKIK